MYSDYLTVSTEKSVFFYYLKENMFHCITSILLLEQKQAIKYVCQHIRTSKTYYQQGEKYDEKNRKRSKNDKIPRARF